MGKVFRPCLRDFEVKFLIETLEDRKRDYKRIADTVEHVRKARVDVAEDEELKRLDLTVCKHAQESDVAGALKKRFEHLLAGNRHDIQRLNRIVRFVLTSRIIVEEEMMKHE